MSIQQFPQLIWWEKEEKENFQSLVVRKFTESNLVVKKIAIYNVHFKQWLGNNDDIKIL